MGGSGSTAWPDKLKSEELSQTELAEKIEKLPDENKAKIFEQLDNFEKNYPGGMTDYIKRAKELLASSLANKNPFEGYVPQVPEGIKLKVGSEEFMKIEESGLEELYGYTGFVLVAGGLGERLGYPGIKLELPIDSITSRSFLEHYISCILEYQRLAREKNADKKNVVIPLAIMTSDDTHKPTEALLEKHKYFGMEKTQITLMKQEMVPALCDNDAKLATEVGKTGLMKIVAKPHGHGDVHTLLLTSGVANKWKKAGFRWIVFFQDTNGLIFNAWPSTIGTSKKENFFMNSVSVPRKPGEQMGGICRLVKKVDDKETALTINVEYNLLGPMLKNNPEFAGDKAGDDGFSKFPGNINAIVCNLDRYDDVLNKTKGVIPEFINPKYTNDTKIAFKTPSRLECLMQDLPKCAEETDKIGLTQLDRWFVFSPVKNDVATAACKVGEGIHPECAFSEEADYYAANETLLKMAAEKKSVAFTSPGPKPVTFAGVNYPLGPKVVIEPSCAVSVKQLMERLDEKASITLHDSSVLVLKGNVKVDSKVDIKTGSLIAKPNADGSAFELSESATPTTFDAISNLEDPVVTKAQKIRGFVVKGSPCGGEAKEAVKEAVAEAVADKKDDAAEKLKEEEEKKKKEDEEKKKKEEEEKKKKEEEKKKKKEEEKKKKKEEE
eukprot:Selendium_serpulae@DN2804_c0_g1_i1.p1